MTVSVVSIGDWKDHNQDQVGGIDLSVDQFASEGKGEQEMDPGHF